MSLSVISEVQHRTGVLTLNAEKSLNALTIDMIRQLQSTLTSWKVDDSIKNVILKSAVPKAFCAGGDVRHLYRSIIDWRANPGNIMEADWMQFFIEEYTLDYFIHRFPKPIVALTNGITMGGGIGLMSGCTLKIGAENSSFAMPEISIGLYPDVGATWTFNRLKPGWGLFLAVTGVRIDAWTAHHIGLIDGVVEDFSTIIQNIISQPDRDIMQHVDPFLISNGEVMALAAAHDTLMLELNHAPNLKHFLKLIEKNHSFSLLMESAWKNLLKGSPTSIEITWRRMKSGKASSLADVFRDDLNLSAQCALHSDFTEGVRALLIDKDHQPKWTPAALNLVTYEWIDSFFKNFLDDANHSAFDL